MSELFPLEAIASESPRVKWMREHDVRTESREDDKRAANMWGLWEAYSGKSGLDRTGNGDTEEEAVIEFAKRNHLLLWNEHPAHGR